ncbi:MAG: M56 family metallopeptidase [bacterium]|nr:M56 family metallopeptidase [bacterium]
MINYSFSTVLMTVLTSTVLIGIIAICFQCDKILISIGDKLLAILILLSLLRFIFPFEIPLARTVLLPKSLSVIITVIRHTFFSVGPIDFSIWFLLGFIWICGTVYKLVTIVFSHVTFRNFTDRYGMDVTNDPFYRGLLNEICDSHKTNFRIIRVPGLDTPRQSGAFRPRILLPAGLQMTEEETYFTLYHEAIHYWHHDFLIKQGMNLLTAIYWWNPLCHILNHQLDVLLEVKVDHKVTHQDPDTKVHYYNALLHIGDKMSAENKASEPNLPSYLETPRAVGSAEDLTKRATLVLHADEASKPLFLVLLAFVVSLFVCSYCFTLEAHYLPERDYLETPEAQSTEIYAVLLDDGTYDIYWNGAWVENTDSIDYYINIPVINLE